MTLLEAAQKALPGLAWEQIGSSEVEYIYAEKNGDGYGVFDLADLDELVTDMTARRDALDDLLGATPRCVMTDELAALRAQLAASEQARSDDAMELLRCQSAMREWMVLSEKADDREVKARKDAEQLRAQLAAAQEAVAGLRSGLLSVEEASRAFGLEV